MRLAVIDLGTNTCNLLIAETGQKGYQILYQGKEGVKLGKGGINRQLLTPEAFQRALSALKKHKTTIEFFHAEKTEIIATSAVRDAANREEFAAFLLKETGFGLTIISGEEEAGLIFKGVNLAFGEIPDNSLILDIGGGSNEFILTDRNGIAWKRSFPLGMSRVIEQFSLSDPITETEISSVEQYFKTGLKELENKLSGINISQLIGCSGAFDTLADLLENTPSDTVQRITKEIPSEDFEAAWYRIIHSTARQRERMTGMDPLRVEMIVPSFILMRFVMKNFGIGKMVQTGFSLREGVLQEWINH